MTDPSGPPGYNPIFEAFVDPDDLEVEQLVAYGLYKIAKREWATALWTRENRKPTDGELAAYIQTWTPSRLEGTRKEAKLVLSAFAGTVVEDAAPAIREEALRGTWTRTVVQGLVAALLYTLILVAVAFVLRWSGVDLLSVFSAVSNGAS